MRLFFIGPRVLGIRPGVSMPLRLSAGRGGMADPGSGATGAFVYVVKGDHNLTKIGMSTNPDARLAQLRTASPFPIAFASVFAVDGDAAAAVAVEQSAHAILARHRVAGEWFDAAPEMAVAAISVASQRVGRKIVQVDADKVAEVIRLSALSNQGVAPSNPIVGGFKVFGVILALSILFAVAVALWR